MCSINQTTKVSRSLDLPQHLYFIYNLKKQLHITLIFAFVVVKRFGLKIKILFFVESASFHLLDEDVLMSTDE